MNAKRTELSGVPTIDFPTERTETMSLYDHLLEKARDAKEYGEDAWHCQSTGEKLAVALVLNRADWLATMNYTIAEAIGRLESEWVMMVPRVAEELQN